MGEKVFERNMAIAFKKARENKGVSQAIMKIDTGINIGRIETGSYSIEVRTFLKICIYLELDCREILHQVLEKSFRTDDFYL